nr:uncharacterized protein LOC108086206 [Drosophila kikkawai]
MEIQNNNKKCEHEARSWVKDLQPGRAFKRPPTHLGVGVRNRNGSLEMELGAWSWMQSILAACAVSNRQQKQRRRPPPPPPPQDQPTDAVEPTRLEMEAYSSE